MECGVVYRPIHVFWHVYVVEDRLQRCKAIIRRQYDELESSGLLNWATQVHIGYVSKLPFPLTEVLDHPKIHIAVSKPTGHEGVTTSYLKRFCDSHIGETYVLYIHTRGVTRQPDTPADDWTLMIEHFNVTRWTKAIYLLQNYLTCGCELWPHRHRVRPDDFSYHYSGNFWWARSSYIQCLPPPTYETRHMQSEDWVLQLAGKGIARECFGILHRTAPCRYARGTIDSYRHRYPREYYNCGNETPDHDLAPLLGKPNHVS